MRTKVLVALLTVALLAPATAARPSPVPAAPPTAASDRIDAVRQRGTLRVAVLDEFPWLMATPPGSPEPFQGAAWLLAKTYADRLGVQLQTVPVGFDDKVAVLADDRADITIAPLLRTPERERTVDFIPYSMAAHCVFARADNPKIAGAQTLDDLDRSDIVIGAIAHTPQGAWLTRRLPRAKSREVAGSLADLATDEVVAGRADVAPIDKFFFAGLAKRVPGLVTIPRGEACATSRELSIPIGMASAKGQPAFLRWLRAVAKARRPETEAEQARVVAAGPR